MDLETLRRQYEAMTDEALLGIDPDELTDAAWNCLDNELERRNLKLVVSDVGESELDLPPDSSNEPDWAEEAFAVYTEIMGRQNQHRVGEALRILLKAGMPCFSKMTRHSEGRMLRTQCELLVPFNRQLQALSLLDKEFFNPQIEADWRGHFGMMSNDELLALDEDALVAGLRDRADRLVRAWEDELLKRGLAELESGN
jgi:hypothetical protein